MQVYAAWNVFSRQSDQRKESRMPEASGPTLSVAALFAEREARRLREREEEEQLKRRQQEELSAFKKRLNEFHLTEAHVQAAMNRIKRAFERGETEIMLTSFPSDFCTDSGRAISNAGAPPLIKPDKKEQPAEPAEPEWLATLPAGARLIYEYWKKNLQQGGFTFTARIINYPGGMPGDVGLFFSWPKSSMEG
jgi:hypothetical protein